MKRRYYRLKKIQNHAGSATIPFYFWVFHTHRPEKWLPQALPIALATDYNPGSTPSGNMNFVVATCQNENDSWGRINAATINAAYAMGISDTHMEASLSEKSES
jgi:imidazolonepropionase